MCSSAPNFSVCVNKKVLGLIANSMCSNFHKTGFLKCRNTCVWKGQLEIQQKLNQIKHPNIGHPKTWHSPGLGISREALYRDSKKKKGIQQLQVPFILQTRQWQESSGPPCGRWHGEKDKRERMNSPNGSPVSCFGKVNNVTDWGYQLLVELNHKTRACDIKKEDFLAPKEPQLGATIFTIPPLKRQGGDRHPTAQTISENKGKERGRGGASCYPAPLGIATWSWVHCSLKESPFLTVRKRRSLMKTHALQSARQVSPKSARTCTLLVGQLCSQLALHPPQTSPTSLDPVCHVHKPVPLPGCSIPTT